MEEEALIIGNGAAELIFALGYSLRPKRALLPQPTFAEYEQALLAAGCESFLLPTIRRKWIPAHRRLFAGADRGDRYGIFV